MIVISYELLIVGLVMVSPEALMAQARTPAPRRGYCGERGRDRDNISFYIFLAVLLIFGAGIRGVTVNERGVCFARI